MVTTIHEVQEIVSGALTLSGVWGTGSNNVNEIVNPNYPGAEGKGALRGIRVMNMHPSGWWVSGFQQLRLIIDGRVIASGTMNIPYTGAYPGRGYYLNLGMFVLGADYHEAWWFAGSGACCECAMMANQQRVPFHRTFRLQGRWIWHSGNPIGRGVRYDVWYELKG